MSPGPLSTAQGEWPPPGIRGGLLWPPAGACHGESWARVVTASLSQEGAAG